MGQPLGRDLLVEKWIGAEFFISRGTYTTSRPISAVKQDRALSSTVVGDHTETKGVLM